MMEIKTMNLDQIQPADYNPRVNLREHPAEFEKLKQSISAFGLVEPLIWNRRTGNLVGGHQRLSVLQEMGVKEAQVVEVDLDDTQEKILNLSLNRIVGAWDEDRLGNLIESLRQENEELPKQAGFDSNEITRLLDRLRDKEDPEGEEANKAKTTEPPITQKARLWSWAGIDFFAVTRWMRKPPASSSAPLK